MIILDEYSKQLSKWMEEEYKFFFSTRRVSAGAKESCQQRAKNFLENNQHNKNFKVYVVENIPVAMISLEKHPNPRTKNQHLIETYYDPKRRPLALQWLNKQFKMMAPLAPKASVTNVLPSDEKTFMRTLKSAGFSVRYELLRGEPKIAYKNLVKKKNPPKDLSHLGLTVRPLKKSELNEAMKLQRTVSLKAIRHTYYSHKPELLKKDRQEYARVLNDGNGLILAVHRGKKLVGLMMTTIFASRSKDKMAGFSFFLDPSIQGKGVLTVGYRLLLEFQIKNGVKSFIGGTSQPAVKALGRVMKRKAKAISYLKM